MNSLPDRFRIFTVGVGWTIGVCWALYHALWFIFPARVYTPLFIFAIPYYVLLVRASREVVLRRTIVIWLGASCVLMFGVDFYVNVILPIFPNSYPTPTLTKNLTDRLGTRKNKGTVLNRRSPLRINGLQIQ